MRIFDVVEEQVPVTVVSVSGWPGVRSKWASLDVHRTNEEEVREMRLREGEPRIESAETASRPDDSSPLCCLHSLRGLRSSGTPPTSVVRSGLPRWPPSGSILRSALPGIPPARIQEKSDNGLHPARPRRNVDHDSGVVACEWGSRLRAA